MAQLVVAAAGAALGGFIAPGIVAFGMTGASLGWMAGSMLGSAFAPTQKSSGPQLSDLSVSTSAYGTAIPYVQGHPRIAGQIVWASTKREIATTQEAGKGGGGSEYTTFTYEVDLLILLTDNVIGGVSRVWSNGDLIYSRLASADAATIISSASTSAWQRLTVYTGDDAQLPDPTYEAAVGSANAPAYRGRGSIFIQALQLGGGGQIPNLTFEVYTAGTPGGIPIVALLAVGSANGTTMLDDSIFADQATGVGSIGPSTGRFDGAGYRLIGASSARDFTSAQLVPSHAGWTAEFWVKADALTNSVSVRVFTIASGADYLFIEFARVNTNYILSLDSASFGKQYEAGGAFALGEWMHFEISGSPSATNSSTCPVTVYKSGAAIWASNLSLFSANGAVPTSGNVVIGSPGSGHPHDIVIDDVRYTAGLQRHTANFAPPTAPPTDDLVPPVTLGLVSLQSVVSSLLGRTGLTDPYFDVTALATITKPVRSMAISSVSSARTVLDMLAQSYHFEAVLSDKIYFRPRASAPAATLTFDELGVIVDSGTSPEPLPLTQANELEIPAQMALTYSNVDGDYQTDTQYSDRLLTGQESTSAMQVPLGFTSSEAKQIVDAMLLDKAVSALTTSVSLGVTRAALEPTDVVLLTGEDGSSYRMRIVKKAEASGVTTLECVQDDSTVFTQSGTTTGGTASQTTVLATPTTTLALLDVPLLRDVDNLPGHYVSVKGSAANWTSCALYESADDLTFTQNTVISGSAVIGACTTTLGAWLGGNFVDDSSVLTVNVGTGQLSSVTHEGMLSSASTNAALVGDEIIQFREATLVSAGVYDLRGLLRGKRGTEWATGTHSSAERFVLLSGAGMRFIAQQTSDIGKLIYYKAATSGQKLSAVLSQGLTLQAQALKPLSPVNLRSSRGSSGDIVLSWDRRTRLSENWLLGTLPVGESAEAYEVEIRISGVLKRTLTSSNSVVTYGFAEQYIDTGGLVGEADVAVYQVSTAVGRGHPLEKNLTIETLSALTGSQAPGANNVTLYPFGKAGAKMLAYSSATYGSSIVHKVFESIDDGASFTRVTGLGAPLTSLQNFRALRSDGVYVSFMGEQNTSTISDPRPLVRGVVGTVPVAIAQTFTPPNLPISIATDDAKFLILTEGNKLYTSTDGSAWTYSGVPAGLPYVFASALINNYYVANYGGNHLHWVAGRWFLAVPTEAAGLYYTTDATAMSGWTACSTPSGQSIDAKTIAQYGGALYCVGGKTLAAGRSGTILRSTDSGVTWTQTAELQPVTYTTLSTMRVIDGKLCTSLMGFGSITLTSTDGTTWTQTANDQYYFVSQTTHQSGANLVILANRDNPQDGDSSNQIVWSPDGINFTQSTGI